MDKTFIACTLAAVFSLGSVASVSAAEVIHHADIKFVVSGAPEVKHTGETFEAGGKQFNVPLRNKADADLAALENDDTILWSDDDPDIVLIGD